MFYRSQDRGQRNTFSPVAIRQEGMHHADIEFRWICADLEVVALPVHRREILHALLTAFAEPCPDAACFASAFSISLIFSTRRSWRPPANCVFSHLSTIATACSGLRILAPSVNTLALLCSRLIWASYSVLTLAARTPATLLAAMAMPIPLPHTRIPRSARASWTSWATARAKSG